MLYGATLGKAHDPDLFGLLLTLYSHVHIRTSQRVEYGVNFVAGLLHFAPEICI